MSTEKGTMFILSSPTAAGKSTLTRRLLDACSDMKLSVSVTTRAPRRSEVDGVDYHFITPEKFHDMKGAGRLLEWAQVHEHFYGTPAEMVEKTLTAGQDVLFDIDVQGARALTTQKNRKYGKPVSIFILPPSVEEMKKRLMRRGEDTSASIRCRLESARTEISFWSEYDYLIINDQLEEAFAKLHAIVIAEKLKTHRVGASLKEVIQNLSRELNGQMA